MKKCKRRAALEKLQSKLSKTKVQANIIARIWGEKGDVISFSSCVESQYNLQQASPTADIVVMLLQHWVVQHLQCTALEEDVTSIF